MSKLVHTSLAMIFLLPLGCNKGGGGDSGSAAEPEEVDVGEQPEEDNKPILDGGKKSAQKPTGTGTGSTEDPPAPPVSAISQPGLLVTQAGATLSFDINETALGAPGDDDQMTYTCEFDDTIDGSVTSGADCSTLAGGPTFDIATGAFSWTVPADLFDHFEFKVSGTGPYGTSAAVIPVVVRQDLDRSKLRVEFDGDFASSQGAPADTNPTSWHDLTGNGFAASFDGGSWLGDGTAASPWIRDFAAGDKATLPAGAMAGQTQFMLTTWVKPGDISAAGAVIIDNGGDGSNGFRLFQSAGGTGQLELKIGAPNSAVYSTEVLNDAPLAYYRLGESAGTTATDLSGNGLDGSYDNGVVLGATGALTDVADTAASFDGSNDQVSATLTGIDTTAGNDVTVEFWMKWDGSDNQMAVGFGSYDLWLRTGNFGFNTGNSDLLGINAAGLINVWTYVVAVFRNGDPTQNKLYINGVEQTLTQFTSSPASRSVSANFRISGWTNDANYKFGGDLDEVAVYNGALAPTRVAAHYNAGVKDRCLSTGTMNDNEWSHLGVLFDGANARLFLNSKEECILSGVTSYAPAPGIFTVGSAENGGDGWTGSISQMMVWSTSDGSSPGAKPDLQEHYRVSSNRMRQFPLLPTALDPEYVLRLDPANARNTVAFPGVGCTEMTWGDLSGNGSHGSLTGFSSCDATTGWNGTGVDSDPYRLSFDGANDLVTVTASLDTAAGARNTISFWMYWLGNGAEMPIGFDDYDMYFFGGDFGFNTFGGDIWGISSAGLENRWVHVAAEFHNGDAKLNKLYIDGVEQTLTQRLGTTGSKNVTSNFTIGHYNGGSSYHFTGDMGEVSAIPRALTPTEVADLCNASKDRYAGASCP